MSRTRHTTLTAGTTQSDAFGLMAISYEPPEASLRLKLNYPKLSIA